MKINLKQIPILGFIIVFIGCAQTSTNSEKVESQEHPTQFNQPSSYAPGLGNMMVTMQTYHTKLFYAGREQNWELALYFVHELEETLEDIETYHGEHNGNDINGLVEGMAVPAIKNIEQAISSAKTEEFVLAYDRLTNTCNSCHSATGKSFIRIQTPIQGDYLNQDFKAAHFNR